MSTNDLQLRKRLERNLQAEETDGESGKKETAENLG
jgi:hypothetical protein